MNKLFLFFHIMLVQNKFVLIRVTPTILYVDVWWRVLKRFINEVEVSWVNGGTNAWNKRHYLWFCWMHMVSPISLKECNVWPVDGFSKPHATLSPQCNSSKWHPCRKCMRLRCSFLWSHKILYILLFSHIQTCKHTSVCTVVGVSL